MADEEPISEWEQHAGDQEWFDKGDELYETLLDRMIEDYGSDVMDDYASELMYDAWFNADSDSFDRAAALFEFFDYTGIDAGDFDWEAWREWYEG